MIEARDWALASYAVVCLQAKALQNQEKIRNMNAKIAELELSRKDAERKGADQV